MSKKDGGTKQKEKIKVRTIKHQVLQTVRTDIIK